jgi:hypothetical protein
MEIKDVLSLEIKPKEKVDKITNIVLEDPSKIGELMINFKQGARARFKIKHQPENKEESILD